MSHSRFDSLRTREIELFGRSAMTLSGTPADCANFGIHHLSPEKPNFILSGINAGQNTGLGFTCASGTICAALAANVQSCPAIAISQHFPHEIFQSYIASYQIDDATLMHLRNQLHAPLQKTLSALCSHPDFFKIPITWNINLPFDYTGILEFTSLSQTRPLNVFTKDDEDIRFELRVETEQAVGGDSNALAKGHISVSPLDLQSLRFACDNPHTAIIQKIQKDLATSLSSFVRPFHA
jgi:5'/3'-nucleotidase SurE